MKIGNRSRKRSHQLDGLSRKNQNVSISYDSVANGPVKTRLSESEAEEEELTSHKAQHGFICLIYRFCFRLGQSRFHYIGSDGVISGLGVVLLTLSVLIFSRWYHSTLLIRIPPLV